MTIKNIKDYALGVAASTIVTPLSVGLTALAAKVGLIEHEILDEATKWKNIAENDALEGHKIDVVAILQAECRFEEYIQQLSMYYPVEERSSVMTIKVFQAFIFLLYLPLIEEVIFRELIQNDLLKRCSTFIRNKFSLGLNASTTDLIDKVARVIITASLFSLIHFQNAEMEASNSASASMVQAFFGGIGLGIIKESRLGLLGSLGAHMAHNFAVLLPSLRSC